MWVHVVAFATAADALGTGELALELPAGARIDDLRTALLTRTPNLEALWPRLAIAVDGAIVGVEEALRDGVEVALLPPVSGG